MEGRRTKKEKWDAIIAWGIVITLITLIVMFIYMGVKMPEEGHECIKNPVEYYQKDMNVSCFCSDYTVDLNGETKKSLSPNFLESFP